MSIFSREEIFADFSSSDFHTAMNALKDAKIKYRPKMRSMGGRSIKGINLNYCIQYAISVDEKDAESARYFINKALHDK